MKHCCVGPWLKHNAVKQFFSNAFSLIFNEEIMLSKKTENNTVVYSSLIKESHSDFVLPIKLALDPMKHLIVISLKGDSEYEMLEPQLFDDKLNGKGIRVLRYRKDKKVDVYWQPGVNVDSATLSLGDGIGDFEETEFIQSIFEISSRRVSVDVSFVDKQKRIVNIRIDEQPTSKKRMSFLAPVGNDIKFPKQFFLAYMLDFDFILKKGAAVDVSIGDKKLTPSIFPLPRNFRSVYFSRYSGRPAIATLNSSLTNPIVIKERTSNMIEIEGMNIEFDHCGKISRLFIEENKIIYEIYFCSGFFNMLNIRDSEIHRGEWVFNIGGAKITGGSYSLSRNEKIVTFKLDVTQSWKPLDLPLSFRIFTRLNGYFRNWPSTYIWESTVDLENMSISGNWKRKLK